MLYYTITPLVYEFNPVVTALTGHKNVSVYRIEDNDLVQVIEFSIEYGSSMSIEDEIRKILNTECKLKQI